VATQAHFLYWASDPLDNPDYERFCDDFFEVVGTYPLFTTALAHKDPERTRALIDRARGRGARINRFSILTLKQLDQVHAAFSAEELLPIELITLNQESLIVKSNAGRFRQRALKRPEIVDQERAKIGPRHRTAEELAKVQVPTSIACVSGFLFNMVDRSVRLISPCRASDRWPLGYLVFAEGTFTGPADLRRLLRGMRDDHMPEELAPRAPVAFRRDLEFRRTERGFEVWTPFGGLRYGDRGRSSYFGDLGELLRTGSFSPAEVADRLFDLHGVLPGDTRETLDRMFERGLLAEELPPPAERLIRLSAAR
jgi:radical SAM family RiPP maturation amino acid epimerase